MAENLKSRLAPFIVTKGKNFKLKDHPTARENWKASKKETKKLLQKGTELLRDQQEKLYAQDQRGVLLIFQAMDAAGKDGAIKHVMSGINPQGCQVYSFKSPSPEELDHDFLWRTTKSLPERGRIGIFNRSYYEEVLVVRVHPEYPAEAEAAAGARDEGHLEGSLRGHQCVRAVPGAQRLRDPEVLPQRVEEGAEEAFPRAPRAGRRRTGSSRWRTPRSGASGRSTWRRTRT